jgi:hypothetical protein
MPCSEAIITAMKTDIKQYVTLRTSLEQERAELHARLKEVEAALGVAGAAPLPVVKRGPGRPKGSTKTASQSPVVVEKAKAPKRKYKRSAAARKRMAEAQKARYAKARALKEGESGAEISKPAAKRKGPGKGKP